MLKKVMLFSLGFAFLLQTALFAEEDKNISKLFGKNQVIKVFVKDITNESGSNAVSPVEFKKEVEKAFSNRKAVSFKVVTTAAESDIQVSGVIKQFQYLNRGPLKPTLGLETAAIDAVATATQNYADLLAKFTITDTKNNKVVWDGEVYDYLKKEMTEAESVPRMYDKVARKFVMKSFGKARK